MIRIIVQLVLIVLPLGLFGIYRWSTAHRREPGEPWPVIGLVVAGFALSVSLYLFLFLREPRHERTCSSPPRLENGEVIPGRTIPCENVSIDSRRHDVERRQGEIDEEIIYDRPEGGVGE